MKTSVIEVHDMLSVWSVDEVEKRIGEVPGVESVTVNYAAKNATVRFDETQLQAADIKSAVRQSGYESAGESPPTPKASTDAPAPVAPAGNGHPEKAAPGKPSSTPAAAAPKPSPAAPAATSAPASAASKPEAGAASAPVAPAGNGKKDKAEANPPPPTPAGAAPKSPPAAAVAAPVGPEAKPATSGSKPAAEPTAEPAPSRKS